MNKFIKRIKNNQALYILSILIIGILLLLIARITYAYLAPRIQNALGNVTTISDTVDDFKLELGRPLSLNATATTLPESGSNLVVTSTEIAKLKANSTKKTANYNYYLYLQITNNTFKYSDGTTPEIILTITDPNGNEITSLGNLTYGTYNGVSGFDVTTKTGLFNIANNYEITSNSSSTYTEHDWNITLTYLNLNIDQSGNYGNSFETRLYLQKEEKELTIADICSGKSISDCVIAQYTGTQGENNIYFHDANLTNGAGDNSYRYAGANPNNYVCFGSDDATCPTENLYRIIGLIDEKIKLISADGTTTDMLGIDGGYAETYQAAWGSMSKYYKGNGDLTKISSYYWSKSTNTWSDSTTNTINLNKNFLAYLDGKDAKWKTMIDDTTWYVGGLTYYNAMKINAKTAYDYEVGANKDANTTVTAKIGLMYLSEYYYGANPDYWTLPGSNYDSENKDKCNGCTTDYRAASNDNWLCTGLSEWVISRGSELNDDELFVIADGRVDWNDGDRFYGYNVVRPSFYLTPSVKYASGDGTSSSPYRIS